MKKLWAKIMKNNKIAEESIVCLDNNFSADNLYEPLKELCYNLKIETPIVLKKHKNQLEEFNQTKFVQADFVDVISFDNLALEYFEINENNKN